MMILAVLAIVFIGTTLVLLLSNYFGSGPTDIIDFQSGTDISKDDLPIYTDLGSDILDDERLDDLVDHGEPITPGQMGRSNPFVIVESD